MRRLLERNGPLAETVERREVGVGVFPSRLRIDRWSARDSSLRFVYVQSAGTPMEGGSCPMWPTPISWSDPTV